MLLYVRSSLSHRKIKVGRRSRPSMGPGTELPGGCHQAHLLGEVEGTSRASSIHRCQNVKNELKNQAGHTSSVHFPLGCLPDLQAGLSFRGSQLMLTQTMQSGQPPLGSCLLPPRVNQICSILAGFAAQQEQSPRICSFQQTFG